MRKTREIVFLGLLWPPYGIWQAIILFALWFDKRLYRVYSGLSNGLYNRYDNRLYRVNRVLECTSETCCARLAENTAGKKSPKSRHLGTIPQLCRAIGLSSQLRHVSTIGKNLLSTNISPICPHNMVIFGPL